MKANHMNPFRSRLILLFCLTSLGISSCQKGDTASTKNSPAPKSNCMFLSDSASGQSEKVNYDSQNQILSIESKGYQYAGVDYTSIVPVWDNNNRLYTLTYYNFGSTAMVITYTYGPTSITMFYDQHSPFSFTVYRTMGPNNRPISDSIPSTGSSVKRILNYTYDAKGNLLSDGTTTYTYDDMPNPTKVLAFLPALTYGNSNNILTAKSSFGTSRYSYTYDASGKVTQLKLVDNTGASSVFAYSYSCK